MCILLSALVRLHNCLTYAALHLENCIPCMQFKMNFFNLNKVCGIFAVFSSFQSLELMQLYMLSDYTMSLGIEILFIFSLQQILTTLSSSLFMCSLSINSCTNFFLYGELHPHDLFTLTYVCCRSKTYYKFPWLRRMLMATLFFRNEINFIKRKCLPK